MPNTRQAGLLAVMLCSACASHPDQHTLAELHDVQPEMDEVQIADGLNSAMRGYRQFLEQTPESGLTPEAMRRLADLKLEKDFGVHGGGTGAGLPQPEASDAPIESHRARATGIADHSESRADFERRASAERAAKASASSSGVEHPAGVELEWAGPLEAIALYDEILETYPAYPHNDQVLYQKARAFDELARSDEAIEVVERLIAAYPDSKYIDEVQFRRAEYFFTRKRYRDAEEAYTAVTQMGVQSLFYELALYKLGWTLYKQDMYEEALHQYVALLDHKVATGFDFDRPDDEADERRIADTYRVISLSFSYLGGPTAVQSYFAANGKRRYEDRIYSHLGEFYLDKLRYADAATSYETFVSLYAFHRSSPHFGMRMVEIYEAGDFPILVLEAKKDFAARYGLQSEYWLHFDVSASQEVLSYLKANLKDLANHYHALYQQPQREDDRAAHFDEAAHWYRAYLASFPDEPETPGIHYQLADLILEHEDFGTAAREYEHIAYDYPTHEQSAAAGYAAIYAHRENENAASDTQRDAARRDAVESTLRFVDTFPDHEQAPIALGTALDDLYDMKQYARAIERGRSLIEVYPDADVSVRRSAWTVVAHASLDTASYAAAEHAYQLVLEMAPAADESRQGFVENLAAAIYQQGEQAKLEEDHRLAADHFLRIREVAPTSEIRAAAEYDAGAALIRLEDWASAARVLEDFRQAHPDHGLNRDATKQIAFVYRQTGDNARAADEYERVAAESDDPAQRSEALLLAGELYEDAGAANRALAVYRRYVDQFREPLEVQVETRFKIARLLDGANDQATYLDELRTIVAIDASAGEERTERVRYLAARSALVLAEVLYRRFDEVALVQPFEQNLQEKRRRMDIALEGFGALADYEVGEVVAAATFYLAEVYFDFSKALIESERPADLEPTEKQDYETVLEEEAFPFEERAIAVHEKNLELMAAGVFNPWVEKSLGQLAELMPGRYAKFEQSSGLITSIESYAYRSPGGVGPKGEGESDRSADSEDPTG